MEEMPDGRQWHCPDCSNKQHICLICNQVGNDQASNMFPLAKKDDVFCCSMARCGRYYHKHCLDTIPGKVTLFTATLGETRTAPTKFRCPQHYCSACDVRYTSGGSMMMKCNRCESSYHMTCVDKAKTQRISKHNIVCERHCPEGQTYRWTKAIGSVNDDDGDDNDDIDPDDVGVANPPKRPRLKEDLISLDDQCDAQWAVGDVKKGEMMPSCSLCSKPWEHRGIEGEMLPPFFVGASGGGTRVWVHEECANFSPEVFIDEKQRYCNVVSAIKRSRRTSCAGCDKSGATIGCIVGTCKSSFHLGCAFESGWTFAAGDSTYICPKHRLGENESDTWCYCKTPEDKGGFWMACDQCENWFHPRCISLTNEIAKSFQIYRCPCCREKSGMVPLSLDDVE
jgi:hypothetical protein